MRLSIGELRGRSYGGSMGWSGLAGNASSLQQLGSCSASCVQHRLKRARELFEAGGAGAGGRRFSDDTIAFQPFLKSRYLHDRNPVRLDAFSQGFPYDPDPAETTTPSSSSYGFSLAFSNGGSSCAPPFAMPRPLISSLKVELPSVQLAESADSAGTPSSALSSPFASCPALSSEVDSFTCSHNANHSSKNSSLLEAMLQQAPAWDGIDQAASDVAEQLLVMTSSSSSPNGARVADASQKSYWMADNDPLSFLGGRSLTLFSEEIKATEKFEASSSNTTADSTQSISLPTVGGDPEAKLVKDQALLHSVKTEEQGMAVCNDEELFTLLTFERPDALPVGDLYDQAAMGGAGGTGVSDQEEEVCGNGGLEAIFGQEVAFDLEQLAAVSGISNAWELGSCVWNNMPGAMQVGETDCRPITSTVD